MILLYEEYVCYETVRYQFRNICLNFVYVYATGFEGHFGVCLLVETTQ